MLLLTLYHLSVPWLLSNCVMLTFYRVCTRYSAYTVLSTWMDIDNELIILILASTKFMISNNKRQSISILKLLAFFSDVKNSLFNRVQLNK